MCGAQIHTVGFIRPKKKPTVIAVGVGGIDSCFLSFLLARSVPAILFSVIAKKSRETSMLERSNLRGARRIPVEPAKRVQKL
jgi:hypothetical protein